MYEDKNQWPFYEEDEINAAIEVLRSGKVNYWTGEHCKLFEKEFSEYLKVPFAISLTNGTAALEVALHGLQIGERNGGHKTDEVIVTSRSFFASVSAIVFAGATPVFADVCEDSQNIEPTSVAGAISKNTRAILCVHLGGVPCEMDSLKALCSTNDIFLIEDCAQAHGASYKGEQVGTFGDVAAWSFCQDKIISTGGEGGMVTTKDQDIWERMWAYKDHGKSYDAVFNKEHGPGFRWLHNSFGTNLRMTEIQAAIGRAQLRKLPKWIKKRRLVAEKLNVALQSQMTLEGPIFILHDESCKGCSDQLQCQHAYYTFNFAVRPSIPGASVRRSELISVLSEQGLPILHGSCPEMYEERAFQSIVNWKKAESLLNAPSLGHRSVMVKIHHRLSDEVIEGWCAAVESAVKSVFSDLGLIRKT